MTPRLAVQNARDWAEEQFAGAQLGDKRRTRRIITVAADLAAKTGSSLAGSCKGKSARKEGAYRLMRNEDVDPQAVAASGFSATATAVPAEVTLLAIGDSTVLSYDHGVRDELGDIGGPEDSTTRGIWAHSVMLVNADSGAFVGLADQQRWIRDEEDYGKKHDRDRRLPEDKESFKWQQSAENLAGLLGVEVMTRVVAVGDRESDIYSYIAYRVGRRERFVVRVCSNRRIIDVDGEAASLFETLNNSKACGQMVVEVAQSGSRPARQAHMTLRAATVQLRRPRQRVNGMPANLTVNVLLVREERPPRGQKALEWRLMTTEPITTAQDIELVVKWYSRRWLIEVFHKAWKSGAGVERLRMQSARNIERMAVLLAFVAVRMLQLRDLVASAPEARCDAVLHHAQWTLLWILVEEKAPPTKCPSSRWAYQALGRLAGWGDTKRTGVVGWKTLWEGWFTLQSHLEAMQLVQAVRSR